MLALTSLYTREIELCRLRFVPFAIRYTRDIRPFSTGFGLTLTSVVRTELFESISIADLALNSRESKLDPRLNPARRGSVISSKNADGRETKLL